MRSGQLMQIITFQRGTEAVSEAGTVSNRWTSFATIRAELVTHTVTDNAQTYGEAAKSSLVFRIRHFHGITTQDRLIWRDQTLAIVSIVEPDRRTMELHCEVVK